MSTNAPDEVAQSAPPPDIKPSPSAGRCKQTGVTHVGVVFAHGIGSQRSGETLREWSAPLIGLLREWRLQNRLPADPIVDTELHSADGTKLFIEVELPSVPNGTSNGRRRTSKASAAPQHWVMTEAWWAGRVVAPSFPEMVSWLGSGGTLARISDAFLRRSPGESAAINAPLASGGFLASVSDMFRRRPAPIAPIEAESSSTAAASRRDALRRATLEPAATASTTIVMSAMAALVLVVYGVLRVLGRLVPIASFKEAVVGGIDNFMLEWFGDVHVLLGDYAQSAGVRARLADSIVMLREMGCERVVIVAHSGGAIVSYLTLCDDQFEDLPVDHLVTLGQGLNLAWKVSGAEGVTRRRDFPAARRRLGRLVANVRTVRGGMGWTDFWATDDPAPLGRVRMPACVEGAAPAPTEVAVWNRLSGRDDHGTYWVNDEEFVIPLARLLETIGSPGAPTRLYPGEGVDPAAISKEGPGATERIQARRERVWMLALWRRALTALPIIAIAIIAVPRFFGGGTTFLTDLGRTISDAFLRIPGVDLVDGLLLNLRSMHVAAAVETWSTIGVAELAVVIAGAVLLVCIPVGRATIWQGRSRERLYTWIDAIFVYVGIALLVAYFIVTGLTLIELVSPDGETQPGWWLVLLFPAFILGPPIVKLGRRWLMRHHVLTMATTAIMVILVSLAVLAPFVALLLSAPFGYLVLGFGAILVTFEGIKRLGAWRWTAWDNRERRLARSVSFRRPDRRDVGIQAVVLSTSALVIQAAVLVAGLIGPIDVTLPIAGTTELAPALAWFGLLLAAAAVVVGVSIDAIDSGGADERAGGSLGRYAETVEQSQSAS